jgi:polyhydroxyalkanoate synthase
MTTPEKSVDALGVTELMSTAAKLTRTGLDLWSRALTTPLAAPHDPLRLGEASLELGASLLRDPAHLARVQAQTLADYLHLGASLLSGGELSEHVQPQREDRRFRDPSWDEHAIFRGLKHHHVIQDRAARSLVGGARHVRPEVRERLEFATQQVLDAVAPSNFPLSNPVVLHESLRSGGRNLFQGLNNLLDDYEHNGGRFDIQMSARGAFTVGKDLGATPGKVVFENELMQLIQYEPVTEEVHRRPLLLVPPWMNKFYILDLRPGNSFIEWLVAQGHTVFVVSWVNPGKELAHKGFEHYMLEGPVAAMHAIEQATGERELNVMGYCLGGILMAATLAYLGARGDDRVRSATLLTTMVDFREAGEVSLFLDEEALDDLEVRIWDKGYLDGRAVYDTFRALRANDLIWSFHVNNYLMGNKPMAFDLLHWNADSTHMPAAMHTFFMRNMYLGNRMREPGGITLADVPIDVSTVRTPTYVLSTMEDHIAPWRTTYYTTGLFGGPVRFVLGESGHIAGVINPPARNKYGYWLNDEYPEAPGEWLDGARREQGSWWRDWARWIQRHRGPRVPARIPGEGGLAAIEDAPGRFVMEPLPG